MVSTIATHRRGKYRLEVYAVVHVYAMLFYWVRSWWNLTCGQFTSHTFAASLSSYRKRLFHNKIYIRMQYILLWKISTNYRTMLQTPNACCILQFFYGR